MPRADLGECAVENSLLGFDEALEIVGIAHAAIMALGPAAEKSGSRLACRREQPRQNVEQDHHRTRQQRQTDEAEADDRWIDAGVVGETGGDAHDLGVAAVDQETSIHLEFPSLK